MKPIFELLHNFYLFIVAFGSVQMGETQHTQTQTEHDSDRQFHETVTQIQKQEPHIENAQFQLNTETPTKQEPITLKQKPDTNDTKISFQPAHDQFQQNMKVESYEKPQPIANQETSHDHHDHHNHTQGVTPSPTFNLDTVFKPRERSVPVSAAARVIGFGGLVIIPLFSIILFRDCSILNLVTSSPY